MCLIRLRAQILAGYTITCEVLMTAPNPKPDPIFLLVGVSQPVSIIAHKHKIKALFIELALLWTITLECSKWNIYILLIEIFSHSNLFKW